MDTFMVKKVVEKFTDSATTTKTTTATTAATPAATPAATTTDSKSMSTGVKIGWMIYSIFSIVIGSWAAYLSWTANTAAEWGTGWKVFFSFFAFLCGSSYLFSYFIYKYDLVTVINKLSPPLQTM